MIEEKPVRLDDLDPTARTKRFDGLVGGITRRAAPLLAARRRRTAFGEIASMRRPLLAAAAAIVLFAGVTLATSRRAVEPAASEVAVEQAAPVDFAALFEESSTPLTLDDLIEQAHEESR
jgi:hypothetical protein